MVNLSIITGGALLLAAMIIIVVDRHSCRVVEAKKASGWYEEAKHREFSERATRAETALQVVKGLGDK